jgi:N-acetylglucosamine-6-sulfatase
MPRYVVKRSFLGDPLRAFLLVLLIVAPVAAQDAPNIVVVLVDDLSVNEYEAALSANVWPSIRQHVVEAGTKFTDSFASTALCCPSRTTLLTGQHGHNHGVLDNILPTGGATKIEDTETLPVWLKAAGYRTGFVGKYLNGYGAVPSEPGPKDDPTYIPPGWDDWQALIGLARMWNYKITDNGVVQAYGSEPADYQTDVLRGRALDFIADSVAAGKPFFLQVNPSAPHTEYDVVAPGCAMSNKYALTIRPAPRHEGTLPPDIVLLHGPAYNEEDMSDKPAFLQVAQLTPTDTLCAERLWRTRLEAMMAVDDLVRAIVRDLRERRLLDDTVLIFASDNGYFFGEHRRAGKTVGYEEATRVPLAVRAPGYMGGQVSQRMVLTTDLAPTISELAGASMTLTPEGRSLVPLLSNPVARPWRQRVFGEFLGTSLNPYSIGATFTMVRTGPEDATAPNDSYIVWNTAAREYYDLDTDPYQLTSRHDDPRTDRERAYLQGLVDQFKTCVGSGCSSIEN